MAEDKVTLQVLWQSADAIRVTPFKEGSVLESTVKTSRTCPFHSGLVGERARDILGLLARANSGAPGLYPELIAAGRAIYVDLLPAFLKEKLQEARVKNLLLHLDQPLLGIPWELVHDGDDFLGRRFRIGRVVTLEGEGAAGRPLQRAMRAGLSVLVVADPTGDLPGARAEAEAVSAQLADAPGVAGVTTLVGEVTLRAFRDALSRADVLHFAGHADVGPGGESELRLADGACGPRLLAQLRGQIDMPGLVFMNGCGSTDDTRQLGSRNALSSVSGLASSLLLAGVRHVVGTLWDVRDEVARLFASAFYSELVRGGTIGAAMSAAQGAVAARHGEGSLLWAAHLLYGDPTWQLAPGSNLELGDVDVLDGLEQKYGRDLSAADPAARVLAALMLLRLGNRSGLVVLGEALDRIERWAGHDAAPAEQRLAALAVTTMASAADVEPPVRTDAETLGQLYRRLLRA